MAGLHARAQRDSITLVKTHWNKKKIAGGIWLRTYWFDHTLFGSNQNISIIAVKLNRRNQIDLGVEPHILKPTSQIATEHGAIVAINGNFFNMKDGGAVDYIRSNNEMVNETRLNRKGERTFHQRSAIAIEGNRLSIREYNDQPGWENAIKGEDVMVTGPLLLRNGDMVPFDSVNSFFGRNPRTAVAIKGKRVYLITVDGRKEKAAGMTIREMELLMKWLGMEDAINLDGGGSTTMWIKDFPYGGVVNHPSDNKSWEASDRYKPGMDLDNLPADESKWDHTGERKVANIIFIRRK